jgi:Spy/CpxP family protein refolding chaperone
MTMFTKSTKALVAALVLAATSLAFVANGSARPTPGSWQQGGWSQGGGSFMQERHDPTNTNGF